VSQLKIIQLSRVIGSDRTGARAYSTAIAAVKAYPFVIKTAAEVQKLPGCNGKIAGLFYEWKNSDDDPEKRTIGAVRELEGSQAYQILKRFHSIWGIGPDTATKMYYKHDYRSLEDIIHHHWDKLSRVQQIGVKYYDELLTPISTQEQDRIKGLIDKHAVSILPGIESILVGGYRRGKAECMDVDLLLSHPRDGAISTDFLMDLLRSLEKAELITHTLSVSSPKLHHGDAHRPSKSNFDTLDKALLIWQTKKAHLHRRVDIIIAPTVSAGTALLGWTGATTFERDLRLWCENEKRWKFTSQGVWIGNERVEDTYGWKDGETWVDVEKRIFKKLGIEWREPTERCTE
jgi:DNA polymerase IV